MLHLLATSTEQSITEAKKILKQDKQTSASQEQQTEAASSKGLKLSAYIRNALLKQLQDKKPPNNTDEVFWKEHIN